MEALECQPHLQLSKKHITPVVLTVGDPRRAEQYASLCDTHEEIAYNREYRSFSVTFQNKKFLIVSHGVGSSGAAICFEELIQLGAKFIIRAGTCGSLQPDKVQSGDVIVVHSAVREEGVSALHVPQGYPAVSNMTVYNQLIKHAEAMNYPHISGMVVSSDLFYRPKVNASSLEMYSKARVEAVEMEVSTLFVIGSLEGVATGAICVVDGSPLQWKEGNYDPTGSKVKTGKERMAQIALRTCADLYVMSNK